MRIKHQVVYLEVGGALLLTLVGSLLLRHQDPWLLQWQPHPFYALVLIFALHYGAAAGTICGIVCAILHAAVAVASGVDLGMSFLLDAGMIVRLGLYVAVGMLVGEVTERYIKREQHWRGQLGIRDAQCKQYQSRCAGLEQAYRDLEGRFVGQPETFVTIYNALVAMQCQRLEQLWPALAQVLTRQLSVERLGIWLLQPNSQFCQWQNDDPQPLPALGRLAAEKRQVVDVRTPLSTEPNDLSTDAYMAGPVFAGGDLQAVVVIQALPFKVFTAATVLQFEKLLDLASRNLTRLRGQEAGQSGLSQLAAWQDLLPEPLFACHAEASLARMRQPGNPVTLLACRPQRSAPLECQTRLRQVLARLLRLQLRLCDPLTFQDASQSFVMLVETDAHGANQFCQRVASHADTFAFKLDDDDAPLRLEWGSAQARPDESLSQLLQRALTDMRQLAAIQGEISAR